VVEVKVASSSVGPNIGPQELCVEYFLVDKGGKGVQVVFSDMESNKDNSISGSECEDDCVREVWAVGWKCSGNRHKDLVRGESGDWNGDGSFSGRNRGSFMLRVLMALNSLIRSGANMSDSLTHESCKGE
jgi:hypothetical protein